jgi:hypothetical protein
MNKLTRSDLLSLEHYTEVRADFRKQVIQHKLHRSISLGDHLRLYFEDRLTIQYQIQEMLRIEKVFEASGINEELEAYNPLIPDGRNLKATLMVEYEDVDERRKALQELLGIEQSIWIRIADQAPVFAIANEDLERSTDEKTSAVHFLRFEFDDESISLARSGAAITIGSSHAAYAEMTELVDESRASLVADFDLF